MAGSDGDSNSSSSSMGNVCSCAIEDGEILMVAAGDAGDPGDPGNAGNTAGIAAVAVAEGPTASNIGEG